MSPQFSIIIPTRHRNDLLALCLDCLAPGVQTCESDLYEVIVTDDGSDYTAESMITEKYPWVKWTKGECRGPAANRNNGAKLAQGPWILFTDDDCLPEKGWVQAYADALENTPGYEVYEGRTYADRPRHSLAEVAPINLKGGNLWSCNFVISRKLFDQLAGFDERFPFAAMEDMDFALRIEKSDNPILFVGDAAICHPWRPKGGWPKLVQQEKSWKIYMDKYPEETNMLTGSHYFKVLAGTFIKRTIPSFFKYKGAGFGQAMLEHASQVRMGFFRMMNPPAK